MLAEALKQLFNQTDFRKQYVVTDASVHDSQDGDRGEAQLARIAQRDSSSREPQSSAIPGAGECEPPTFAA